MGQRASQYGSDTFNPSGQDFSADELNGRQPRSNLKHPVAAFFHVIFKLFSFLFYLFGGLFGQDFISTFVAVILLISMDFWVVKNVTGRLLAGLRWSNYIDDSGNSHWIFENAAKGRGDQVTSLGDEIRGSSGTADGSIFWTGQIFATFLWFLLLMVSVFRLNIQWFMLVLLAFILSLTNLYGYIRCRLGTSDIKNSVTQFAAKQFFYNFIIGGTSSQSNRPQA